MKNVVETLYCAIAGILLLVIGASVLVAPQAFFSSNGISLGNNPNLLSEIRAPGALLACGGIFILLGMLRTELRQSATLVAVVVYGAYGLARLLSLMLDGLPSSSLVTAMLLELAFAISGLLILGRAHSRLRRPAVSL